MSVGVKHQDSQNSFLAFLNAPTSALDQFDVSIPETNPYMAGFKYSRREQPNIFQEIKICDHDWFHNS